MTRFPDDATPFIDFGMTGHIVPSGLLFDTHGDVLANCYSLDIPGWNALMTADKVRIELCNPMAKTKARAEVADVIPAQKADVYFRSGNAKSKDFIRLDDITTYADLLTQAAYWLSMDPCDGVIVPLRGGIVPARQLDVMKEYRLEPLLLPFTEGSNKKNYDECRHELARYMAGRLTKPSARIVVIDTAEGGNGSLAMAELIKDVYADLFSGTSLSVDFLLFFDVQGNHSWFPPESHKISSLDEDNLRFRVIGCRTRSLITEGWDESFGFSAGWSDDGTPKIVAAPFAGKVLVQNRNGEIHEYAVERIDQFITDLLSVEVSDALTTGGMKFECDVWEKYMEAPQ